jgi:hypothetical protein
MDTVRGMGTILLLLILVVIAALFIALVAHFIGGTRGRRGISSSLSRNASGDGTAALAGLRLRLLPELASVGYALTSEGPDSFTLTLRYRPVWIAIPIVLLFPVGLVFLLVSNTNTVTAVVQHGEPDVVSVAGVASAWTWETVGAALDAAAVGAAVPSTSV